MVGGPMVQGVAFQGEISEQGNFEGSLTIFGVRIFGTQKYTRFTYDLQLNCKEILNNQMRMSNAELSDQETIMFFFAEPKKMMPHPKFNDLWFNTYCEHSFKVGNVMLTINVDELFGIVQEHVHNEEDFVCEWQFRIDSIMPEEIVCKHGEHHGHPDGWGDCMLAVKLKAKIING